MTGPALTFPETFVSTTSPVAPPALSVKPPTPPKIELLVASTDPAVATSDTPLPVIELLTTRSPAAWVIEAGPPRLIVPPDLV